MVTHGLNRAVENLTQGVRGGKVKVATLISTSPPGETRATSPLHSFATSPIGQLVPELPKTASGERCLSSFLSVSPTGSRDLAQQLQERTGDKLSGISCCRQCWGDSEEKVKVVSRMKSSQSSPAERLALFHLAC